MNVRLLLNHKLWPDEDVLGWSWTAAATGWVGKEEVPLAALAVTAAELWAAGALARFRRIMAILRCRRCVALSTPALSESVSLAVDVPESLDQNWSRRFFRGTGLHFLVAGGCEGAIAEGGATVGGTPDRPSPSSDEDNSMKIGVLGRICTAGTGTAGPTVLTIMQSESSESVSTKVTVVL